MVGTRQETYQSRDYRPSTDRFFPVKSLSMCYSLTNLLTENQVKYSHIHGQITRECNHVQKIVLLLLHKPLNLTEIHNVQILVIKITTQKAVI